MNKHRTRKDTSQMAKKRIAAITMVRNDDFFLKKWVEYYGAQLGRDNLYVYFDGTDQQIPDFCDGTHAELVNKIGSSVVKAEKGRLGFLSEQAARLFSNGYDLVIGCDADEYLVVDPSSGLTLAEYLSEVKIKTCISGLGLDFGQKIGMEEVLTLDKPFLEQRHYAQIGTRYTKAAVVARPCRWGSGFHRVKGKNFHIPSDLYMLHFGYSDMKRIMDRMNDADRNAQGWSKHTKKRARTTELVTKKTALPFGKWTRFARRVEQWVRPPFALNKPGLLGLKIVVEIPERFRNLL